MGMYSEIEEMKPEGAWFLKEDLTVKELKELQRIDEESGWKIIKANKADGYFVEISELTDLKLEGYWFPDLVHLLQSIARNLDYKISDKYEIVYEYEEGYFFKLTFTNGKVFLCKEISREIKFSKPKELLNPVI